MGKLCDSCSLGIPVWDDHPTCVKCRLSAGICTLDINNPCSICQGWSAITWGKLRKSLRDARQKSVKRGTQHWSCKKALLTWMDSATTSPDMISETGSIADSDFRDVDLDLAAVTANTQVVEVSVHSERSVKEPLAIDAGQAPAMDNVIPAPLCVTLITCAHAPPLASTSNQLLCTSTGTPAPLLVTGPSFPPRRQGPISMLPGAPIVFSGAPKAPVAPPCRAPERCRAPHYSLWQACSGELAHALC